MLHSGVDVFVLHISEDEVTHGCTQRALEGRRELESLERPLGPQPEHVFVVATHTPCTVVVQTKDTWGRKLILQCISIPAIVCQKQALIPPPTHTYSESPGRFMARLSKIVAVFGVPTAMVAMSLGNPPVTGEGVRLDWLMCPRPVLEPREALRARTRAAAEPGLRMRVRLPRALRRAGVWPALPG